MKKNFTDGADRFLWRLFRAAWFLVSLLAVYILYYVWKIYMFPSDTLGMAVMLPLMIEHLLASCAVLLGVGALFEYLCRFEQ